MEHRHDFIRCLNVPAGLVTEENLEAFNKDYKKWREFHTFKGAPENSLSHPFERAIIRSHPLMQEIFLQFRKPTSEEEDELPQVIKEMLMN